MKLGRLGEVLRTCRHPLNPLWDCVDWECVRAPDPMGIPTLADPIDEGCGCLKPAAGHDGGYSGAAVGRQCGRRRVATAAALAVVEPGSTGIGGDCFCLFYGARQGVVEAVNGSGRSPRALTLELAGGPAGFDPQGPHAVTVPGTIAGWGRHCGALRTDVDG